MAGRAHGKRRPEVIVWLSEADPPRDEQDLALLVLAHDGLIGPTEAAFARAVLSGSPCVETEVLLRRGSSTVVIDHTVSGVRPFSLTLSSTLAHWKLAALIPRTLTRLSDGDAKHATSSESRYVRAPPPPSATRMIAHAAPRWTRTLIMHALTRRPWSIRVRRHRSSISEIWEADEGLVRWNRGRVYADPFLLEHEGAHHLFCEEVPRKGANGVISHVELRTDGEPAQAPTPVLRASHHLSYPFVFVHEGTVFMVPETSATRRIELYRAVEFPREWKREGVMIDDINAADATLLAYAGRLWLFAAVWTTGATSLDELCLFWSDALLGPWHAHPMNPVVSDVRSARPAGAIQRWGSRLIRPGQDGSRRYGGAVSFREIDIISTTEYREHEIARLEPRDLGDARATHSFAADSAFEAVDLRRRTPRLLWRG